jgi:1-acyl-sn-glycerol-3-phosphate acyltransferase
MSIPIIITIQCYWFCISENLPQFDIARFWAVIVIYGMCWWPIIYRDAGMQGKSVLVANHASMADIMLMLLVAKNPFAFVGQGRTFEDSHIWFFSTNAPPALSIAVMLEIRKAILMVPAAG